ncbi:hypothetical protein C8R46DRAFT_2980 [Mycena filopes]|nr:hypothetical protein C8R46DRAFT_2980 [Mycena filopes]
MWITRPTGHPVLAPRRAPTADTNLLSSPLPRPACKPSWTQMSSWTRPRTCSGLIRVDGYPGCGASMLLRRVRVRRDGARTSQDFQFGFASRGTVPVTPSRIFRPWRGTQHVTARPKDCTSSPYLPFSSPRHYSPSSWRPLCHGLYALLRDDSAALWPDGAGLRGRAGVRGAARYVERAGLPDADWTKRGRGGVILVGRSARLGLVRWT